MKRAGLFWLMLMVLLWAPLGNQCQANEYLDTLMVRVAALFGDVEAQFNLGLMYEQGAGGLKKSAFKAMEWFQNAAEQGMPEAQNKVGFMYESKAAGGMRNRKDNIYAYAYYSLAARNGLRLAEENRNVLGRTLNSAQIQEALRLANQIAERIQSR